MNIPVIREWGARAYCWRNDTHTVGGDGRQRRTEHKWTVTNEQFQTNKMKNRKKIALVVVLHVNS